MVRSFPCRDGLDTRTSKAATDSKSVKNGSLTSSPGANAKEMSARDLDEQEGALLTFHCLRELGSDVFGDNALCIDLRGRRSIVILRLAKRESRDIYFESQPLFVSFRRGHDLPSGTPSGIP